MDILVLVIMPILLLVSGVPIFVVLLAASLGGVALSGNPLHSVHTAIFGSLDSFPLLAVPLFIYAGDIMARGGIARRLIELILSVVGGVRGSLAVATIAASARSLTRFVLLMLGPSIIMLNSRLSANT